MPKGRVATGLVVKKASTAQSWNVTDLNWSGYSIDVLDGSHMLSENFKEKILGKLKDPGQLSITIQLLSSAPPLIDSTFAVWSVEFNGGLVLSGSAAVTGVEINTSVEQIQTATITLVFDGEITLA